MEVNENIRPTIRRCAFRLGSLVISFTWQPLLIYVEFSFFIVSFSTCYDDIDEGVRVSIKRLT